MQGFTTYVPRDVIGPTDRGVLFRDFWRAQSGRILRLLDPEVADKDFRDALEQLYSTTAGSVVQVCDEGFHGLQFTIEYRTNRVRSLEEHFRQIHWRNRLWTVQQICQRYPVWVKVPVHPLGLGVRNIVMQEAGGEWSPWLLPCPAPKYRSPWDFFGCDPIALASIPPEVVRGSPYNERASDMYSLGMLAAIALGVRWNEDLTRPEDWIEAHAIGRLFRISPDATAIEDFLQAEECIGELLRTILHYTVLAPAARPLTGELLAMACSRAISQTDPLCLGLRRRDERRNREALNVLEWGQTHFGKDYDSFCLAADIHQALNEPEKEIRSVTEALSLKPSEVNLGLRRAGLLWQLRQIRAGEVRKAIEDDFLKESNRIWLKLQDRDKQAVLLWQSSVIHEERGDLESACQKLKPWAERRYLDVDGKLRYARLLQKIGKTEELDGLTEQIRNNIEYIRSNNRQAPGKLNTWTSELEALCRT